MRIASVGLALSGLAALFFFGYYVHSKSLLWLLPLLAIFAGIIVAIAAAELKEQEPQSPSADGG